jgi:hypothetical protein
MNIRFTIAYSLISVVIGYVVFFAVSEIPMVEYFAFALSGLLVHTGLAVTVRNEPMCSILRGAVMLVMIVTGYTFWGWPLLWGSIAMSGTGLVLATVYGLLYWVTERRALS